MKKFLFSVFYILIYASCKTVPAPIPLEAPVSLRYITFYNDSGRLLERRNIFTHIPCSATVLTDSTGKILKQRNYYTKGDSACYTCVEFKGVNSVFMLPISCNKASFSCDVHTHGEVQISGSNCSKKSIEIWSRWNDSLQSVSVWYRIDQTKGEMKLFMAEEAFSFPYFKSGRIDSFTYDLNHFCSDEEMREEIRSNQEMFSRHIQVYVNPNPYKDGFYIRATKGKLMPFMFGTDPITISFYDDKGNILDTKPFAFEEEYRFEFPEIASGKLLFYRIQWSVYSISGQILKA